MKGADHHLRRIDQAVVQSVNCTRLESAGPVRLFQLASETRVTVGDPSECEEAILELTGQQGSVLQVLERLSLGVQNCLYALDDFIAVGQEELEQFDMCLKRLLVETRSG